MSPTQAALSVLTLFIAMLTAATAHAEATDLVWPDHGRGGLTSELSTGKTLALCSKLVSGSRITGACTYP